MNLVSGGWKMDGKITKNANKLLIMLFVIIFGLFFLSFYPITGIAETFQEFTKRFIKPDGYFYGFDKEDKLYDTFAKSSKSKTPNILKLSTVEVNEWSFEEIFDDIGNIKLLAE
jgi:hypothetical protein